MRVGSLWILLLVAAYAGGAVAQSALVVSDFPFWNQADTLKAGQSVVTLKTRTVVQSTEFNPDGRSIPLGDKYTLTSRWGDVLKDLAPQDRGRWERALSARGIGLDETAYETRLRVDRLSVEVSPFWALGLTGRWTVGALLPMSSSRLQIRAQQVPTAAWRELRGSAAPSRLPDAVGGENSVEALSDRLKSNDFQGLRETQDRFLIGDVHLLSKYRAWEDPIQRLTLFQTVAFPTSEGVDPYEFVTVSNGDGQFDFGVGILYERLLNTWLRSRIKVDHLIQAPHRMAVRVPNSADDPSQAQVDRRTERDLGDVSQLLVEAISSLSEKWQFSTGYLFYTKQVDTYRGSLFEPSRYRQLGAGTDGESHLARIVASYSHRHRGLVAGSYRQFNADLSVFSALSGRNTAESTGVGLDLTFLF